MCIRDRFLDYGEALPVDAANNTLRFQIFQTAQQQVTRDDDRFYAAMFSEMVDFDEMCIRDSPDRTARAS